MHRSRRLPAAVLLLGLVAGCGGQRPLTDGPLPSDQGDGLARIVTLAAERVTLSDQLAAATFGAPQPVTDPEREAAVVAEARAAAGRAGVDPEWTVRVVADQVAAGTRVRTDLVRLWTDQPATRPAQRPELSRVRSELDRIGDELVAALASAAPARAHEGCPAQLAQAAVVAARPMDESHKAALGRSLASVCDGGVPG